MRERPRPSGVPQKCQRRREWKVARRPLSLRPGTTMESIFFFHTAERGALVLHALCAAITVLLPYATTRRGTRTVKDTRALRCTLVPFDEKLVNIQFSKYVQHSRG